jgi:carbon storage regulator CsrA
MPLVLTRRSGEAIDIGGYARVRVVAIRGRQVRLLIEAPREVRVSRVPAPEPVAADTAIEAP